MFQVIPNPTFAATLTIVGQGREQKLNLVYRHTTIDEYSAKLQSLGKGELSLADVVLDIVESWEADMELSKEGIDLLQQHQPGCAAAILSGYGDASMVARKGN